MQVVFIDGNELLAAAYRKVAPDVTLVIEQLQTGFATSAPEPEQKARDKVLAHHSPSACFAEARRSHDDGRQEPAARAR